MARWHGASGSRWSSHNEAQDDLSVYILILVRGDWSEGRDLGLSRVTHLLVFLSIHKLFLAGFGLLEVLET